MHYRIYLSSTFTEAGGFDWKKALIDSFNACSKFKESNCATFIDPLLFESKQNPIAVQSDMDNIANADVVFFHVEKPTIGTLMEVAFSCMNFPTQLRYFISNNPEVYNHTWIKNLTLERPNCGGNKRLYPMKACHSVQEAVDRFMQDINNEENKE